MNYNEKISEIESKIQALKVQNLNGKFNLELKELSTRKDMFLGLAGVDVSQQKTEGTTDTMLMNLVSEIKAVNEKRKMEPSNIELYFQQSLLMAKYDKITQQPERFTFWYSETMKQNFLVDRKNGLAFFEGGFSFTSEEIQSMKEQKVSGKMLDWIINLKINGRAKWIGDVRVER
jgi:hypothetical protein